jgi:hypothetical protein
MKNIWICPASKENLEMTIKNKYNGQYVWALNANRKKSYEQLQSGDICLFGSLRMNQGFRYLGIVKDKKILTEYEDNWPFKTPSGTFWKYSFTLDIYEINIEPDKMRELRGFSRRQGWQQQTNLTIGKEEIMNYLINNYGCFLMNGS